MNPWTQGNTLPLIKYSSSIIIELNVNVRTIDDCLRLLDGRFNQMKTFIVNVDSIEVSPLNIDNQVEKFSFLFFENVLILCFI